MGIPTSCAPWVYLPPVYLPLEGTWDQGYLPPVKDIGPGIPTPWKGHGTRDTYPTTPAPAPMDRQSPVKTLHSHNFIGGW